MTKAPTSAKKPPSSGSGPQGSDPSLANQSSGNAADSPISWIKALNDGDDAAFRTAVHQRLKRIIEKYDLNNYAILILFDEDDSITSFHSDALYAAGTAYRDSGKDILLVLHSRGGSIEPAYLVSKTLRRIAGEKFSVAVPRRAKSAATLIALGADEIHMGMLSELGPIDPQIGGLPALALSNALDLVAELATRFPGSTDVLTKYLIDQAPIRVLGYFQRVSESAEQYAQRLLAGKTLAPEMTPESIAKRLVHHYKDHSFVIDFEETIDLLGPDIVKTDTNEYRFSDELFRLIDRISMFAKIRRNKKIWIVGDITEESAIGLSQRQDDE